ncbi:MAG: SPFH domain-containing protein [Verrucomicrobia bacterium]|nr:SPFH domain-containing protein [Cytophagales bacterium]
MGLWDKITGQFIDIIEWIDNTSDTMVWRFPRNGNEIKNGAKLIVREGQAAIFVNEGQMGDIFSMSGTFELTTSNLPILTTLSSWKYGFNSPFKAEVYFFNTKQFTNLKWGTKNPIMLRDAEFGAVRLRAFGSYAMRINDPAKFMTEIVGTDGDFTTDEINEQLRNVVVSRFSDTLGESKIPMLDLVANYDELGKFITERIHDDFDQYGLKVTKFLVENISLPPEVEAALDKRSSMGIIGNLNDYTKFQMANSLENGGSGSDTFNAGMGFVMANQMANQMNNPNQTPPPLTNPLSFFVAVNGQQSGPFDAIALQQMLKQGSFTKESLVWKQGMAAWTAAGQVPELHNFFGATPPPIPQ